MYVTEKVSLIGTSFPANMATSSNFAYEMKPITILLLAVATFVLLQSFKPRNKSKKELIHVVLISTTKGDIKVKLYNETPKHRDNFLKLVNEKFYDGLLFHRVIKDFMIQGGDPQSKNAEPGTMLGNGDVGYRIPAEFHANLFHKKGVLAAARDQNPEMASSGCQFYIVQGRKFTDEELNRLEQQMKKTLSPEQREIYKSVGGTPHLDQGYTVFGEVIEGFEVLDQIASVKTGVADRPVEDVRIIGMKELKPLKIKKKKGSKKVS